MVEITHIRKENQNREIHEVIDLENTKQEYFLDKILIHKDGEGTFVLEQEDFESIFRIKKKEYDEYIKRQKNEEEKRIEEQLAELKEMKRKQEERNRKFPWCVLKKFTNN